MKKLFFLIAVLIPLLCAGQVDKRTWRRHLKNADPKKAELIEKIAKGEAFEQNDSLVVVIEKPVPIYLPEIQFVDTCIIETGEVRRVSKSETRAQVRMEREETKQIEIRLRGELDLAKVELKAEKERSEQLSIEAKLEKEKLRRQSREAAQISKLNADLEKQLARAKTRQVRIENRAWGFWDWTFYSISLFGALSLGYFFCKILAK